MVRLTPILFILFLFSCGSENLPSVDSDVDLQDSLLIESEIDQSVVTAEISNLVKQSEVGIEFPKSVMKYGTLVDGALWNDKRGLNYFVIFQMKEGEFFMDGFKSELHAYHYVTTGDNDSIIELSSVHDSSGVIYKTVDYWGYSMDVIDLDNDGLAEVEFIYNITPDGMDERDLKYVLLAGEDELSVKGRWGFDNDSIILTEQIPSVLFEQYPIVFKSHAEQQFEKWIEREKNR